jgi:hypothetical protein
VRQSRPYSRRTSSECRIILHKSGKSVRCPGAHDRYHFWLTLHEKLNPFKNALVLIHRGSRLGRTSVVFRVRLRQSGIFILLAGHIILRLIPGKVGNPTGALLKRVHSVIQFLR